LKQNYDKLGIRSRVKLGCGNYFEDIEMLRDRDPDLVEVSHEPMSERYTRAQMYLDEQIEDGECLGLCEKKLNESKKLIEIASWLAPIKDKFINEEFGSYAVFKTLYEKNEENEYIPQFSELFAYYDGGPTLADKGNKAFSTVDEAIAEMKSYKKYTLCQ